MDGVCHGLANQCYLPSTPWAFRDVEVEAVLAVEGARMGT